MNELPNGWVRAPIGALCYLLNGRAFKPTEWQPAGLPIVRIQNLNNPAAPHNYFAGEVDERNRLRGGELLFAWSGTPGTSFGAHIWSGGDAVLNQHIFRVDFDCGLLDKRFFRFAINQKLSELIDVAHGGVGLRHVTKSVFERTLIELPPRKEQTRIADQLDKLLTRIQACNDRIDAIPTLLKRFRQAVLAVATSGTLTEDWRDEYGISGADWPTATIESIAETVFDGPFGSHLKSADYSGEGVRVVRLENIGALQFLADKQTFIPESKYANLQRHTLKKDDVLFASFVDEEVRVCIYPANDQSKAINKADVFCIRVDRQRCNPRFLALRLGCRTTFLALRKHVHGATSPRINLSQIRGFAIGLPSLDEQAEIVRRVEVLFNLADRIEACCTSTLTQAQRLIPLLLAKAFCGELVPQDPNDEPASELLQRFVNPRTATISSRKKSAKKKGKFMTKKVIIPVVDVLRAANRPLMARELLLEAGYPNDANTDLIEMFFLDLRNGLESHHIERVRRGADDVFSLVK